MPQQIRFRRTFLIIFLIGCSLHSFGQKLFSVKIDPRVEAASIFFTLATVDTVDVKPTPSTYFKAVKDFFKVYNHHPSLNWYRKLDTWDGPDMASIGLFLTDKYPFKLKVKPDVNYIRSAPIDTFLLYFNRFYKECKVADFLSKHHNEYHSICTHGEKVIGDSKILDYVKTFFTSKQNGEFIIYADVLNNHGSNAIISENEGFEGKIISKAGYINDASKKLSENSPVIFEPALNVVAHECSHIYLNNFTKLYFDRLVKIKNHFLTLSSGKVLNELQWENEMNELLVRVAVAKILEDKFDQETATKEINNQSIHFKWAKDLYSFFNNYTSNRKKYKSIEDFYPEIITFLETKAGS
ncbi:DUF4932 domain-containing protein [Pedobacter aquatilis]|uniref:DUF4932 domain-containing protein n=1 Tax=Pedobacter aquatilis TaxID=351343 RepID=UPI00292F59EB|nr:DUF4932 domain-containing protein [Pedobacter aquatilis]